MPQVSLDGIRIEVPHARSVDEVRLELERFAQDLAQNRFPDWGVHLEREGEKMLLKGERGGTHFRAIVLAEATRVTLDLGGKVELNFLKLTLAGGEQGVRERVRETLGDTLRAHLMPPENGG